ncbi:acyl-ACP--UDP-N-acetylglucosamine O-acyltransferase [Haloferula sp.]|uniref:acyl-ACP--UDP-N-acetylglucosamine O-acyltransferase n=1 Tax=Haloferula sp. TaxID=2497595 RepID=UPI003C7837B4
MIDSSLRLVIHPTAIVSPKAKLGTNVQIGPYSVIGDHVELGDGCIVHSHVIIEGPSRFGRENEFFPFAAVGGKTQDLKYAGEPTHLEVGDRNTFRENCTIHRGTHEHTPTRIGNDNLFLCYTHVAHDCQLGDHIILSNNGTLAGHVTVEDHVIVAGMSAVHQFCRLGCHSMIGGMARISQDVAPYTIAEGHDPATRGLNLVGLKRRGFTEDDLRALKAAYKKLFLKKDTNLSVSLSSLKADTPSNNPHVKHLIAFIEASQRGVTR